MESEIQIVTTVRRALGPLLKHKIKSNRYLRVFTCDFCRPHPHRANAAQYLLVCVWSLGDMRMTPWSTNSYKPLCPSTFQLPTEGEKL